MRWFKSTRRDTFTPTYSAKDAELSVKQRPSGWAGSLPAVGTMRTKDYGSLPRCQRGGPSSTLGVRANSGLSALQHLGKRLVIGVADRSAKEAIKIGASHAERISLRRLQGRPRAGRTSGVR